MTSLLRVLSLPARVRVLSLAYSLFIALMRACLAERAATLDDGGQWVGSGQWSDVFTYDKRSNVTQRVDARGVKTIFKYKDTGGNEDPLNRLLAVEYDKSGSPPHLRDNIPDAPNVSYGYMTTTPGDKMRAANITVSNGMGNEQLSYDSEGRLSQVHQARRARGIPDGDQLHGGFAGPAQGERIPAAVRRRRDSQEGRAGLRHREPA